MHHSLHQVLFIPPNYVAPKGLRRLYVEVATAVNLYNATVNITLSGSSLLPFPLQYTQTIYILYINLLLITVPRTILRSFHWHYFDKSIKPASPRVLTLTLHVQPSNICVRLAPLQYRYRLGWLGEL